MSNNINIVRRDWGPVLRNLIININSGNIKAINDACGTIKLIADELESGQEANGIERDIGSIPGVSRKVIEALDLLGELCDKSDDGMISEAWDIVHCELARLYENQVKTTVEKTVKRRRRRRR